MKNYVTLGQDHCYIIKTKATATSGGVERVLNHKHVAVYDSKDAASGREMAFKLFGQKFAFHYTEDNWNNEKLGYYPGGCVKVFDCCDSVDVYRVEYLDTIWGEV